MDINPSKFNEKFGEVKSFLEYYNMYGQPLVDEYAKDLDDKVGRVKEYLDWVKQSSGDFDVPSLQRIVIDLSSSIYYTNDKLEKVNLLADMSKITYKSVYNTAYLDKQSDHDAGTKYSVPQLQAYADTEALEENLINFIYTRAAAVLKGKIDSAYELLKATSKALSAAIESLKQFGVSNKYNL